jgi:hypothetical protein
MKIWKGSGSQNKLNKYQSIRVIQKEVYSFHFSQL